MEYPFKIYFLIKEENRNILIDTGQKIERKKNHVSKNVSKRGFIKQRIRTRQNCAVVRPSVRRNPQ